MIIKSIVQPDKQLGNEIADLINSTTTYKRIIFVSAFASLRTVLRLREGLLKHATNGTLLQLTVGIDLEGTSREVLEELQRWIRDGVKVFVFHNSCPYVTFHPKFYLIESATSATILLGSNNLTEGGFYTNYEAATRSDFIFPADEADYAQFIEPLHPFITPTGKTVCELTTELISALVTRGELPSESEKRARMRRQQSSHSTGAITNPFGSVAIPKPPLLPISLRAIEPPLTPVLDPPKAPTRKPKIKPVGTLMWKKTLTSSDALTVKPGSNPVGSLRLTQAKFVDSAGAVIDQKTYFRILFDEFGWEHDPKGGEKQEYTFVPIRVTIRNVDYGVRNFEISHNPTRAANQGNFTTTLRWGRDFSPIIRRELLTKTILALYKASDEEDFAFWINITDK